MPLYYAGKKLNHLLSPFACYVRKSIIGACKTIVSPEVVALSAPPKQLGKISRLVAKHAHAMAGKGLMQILFGRRGSFVLKSMSTGRRIWIFRGHGPLRARQDGTTGEDH